MKKDYQSIGDERIAYMDRGAGQPILFLHGLPTSSYLWRYVIERLEGRFRCIAPDLMGLGDTEVVETSDLSPPSQAGAVVALMDALGIESAAVVAHDQGGAAAQFLAARYPDRVSKLALVDVVCYDNWPVPGVKLMRFIARLPGSDLVFASAGLRSIANRLGMGLPSGFFDKSKATTEIMEEFIRTVASTPERVKRFKRFLLAGDNRYTMEVAPDLKKLTIPTIIIWGKNDPFISVEWGEKLAAEIPGAGEARVITECGHFVPLEKPGELADLLIQLIG